MTVQIEINEQDLPVLSAVATEALELLQNPNVTNEKLEKLISRDPAMTGRLLHIADSPFYASRVESKSIADAARKLGMRQLHNIITAAATGELFDANDLAAQGLWDHAQAVAIASQAIAESLELNGAAEAYVAGLLHDIGKIVIYRQHKELYTAMLAQAEAEHRSVSELETESFKFFTHMSIGGLVVRKWKLSDAVAEAARYHHDLLQNVPLEMNNASLACVVALANYLVNGSRVQTANQAAGREAEPLDTLACSEKLGLSRERAEKLKAMVEARLAPTRSAAA